MRIISLNCSLCVIRELLLVFPKKKAVVEHELVFNKDFA
jgi:hypothetical protein